MTRRSTIKSLAVRSDELDVLTKDLEDPASNIRSISIRVPIDVRRSLKMLAARRDTSLQALIHEAITDLFTKEGLKSPFADGASGT